MKMLKHIAPLASLALVAACSNGGDVDEQAGVKTQGASIEKVKWDLTAPRKIDRVVE